MPRWIPVIFCCAAVCFAASAVATAATPAPTASAASACKPPSYPGSGYFTSLSVTHVTCHAGRTVALAHYRCRVKNGKRGHCSHRIYSYRCSEGHRESIPTEFDARVTCRRGSNKVVFTYQQNL
jgi:hypothetical protein